jgi:hypothetical protein
LTLRDPVGSDPEEVPAAGVSSAGVNPAPSITLPARTFTEVEFAVRATISARWEQAYAFRLQPTVDTVAVGSPIVVTMGARPPIVLTMPASATRDNATGTDSSYQLALAVPGQPGGPRYPLAPHADPNSPHIESSLTSDGCAACHASHHDGQAKLLDAVYRVNPLKGSTEAYRGADFALCISCHKESPFADTSGSSNPATAFAGHGFHLGDIEQKGVGGQDITVPGDGQGNALCAECHYNIHGVRTSDRGLIRFAPDVTPFNGQIQFDPSTQSCTLTCHGKDHDELTFQVPQPGS